MGLDDVHHTKGHVAKNTLWPYSLGSVAGPTLLCLQATSVLRDHLLWVVPYPTQLLFHVAQERMTEQNPPEINGDHIREQCMPESTRMVQDGSHLGEAMEVE